VEVLVFVSSSTAGSALPRTSGWGVPDTGHYGQMPNDFQNFFILVRLCTAFEEFFHGSLDVILRRTFRKPCLLKLCLQVQFVPSSNVQLCAYFKKTNRSLLLRETAALYTNTVLRF